jgi:peptide chain release factor 2
LDFPFPITLLPNDLVFLPNLGAQTFDNANAILEDAKELLDMAQSESDEETANSVIADLSVFS